MSPVLLPPRGLIHSTAAIATSSTVALAASKSRVYVLLENDSDTDIYIKIGGDAVMNEGVRINGEGGSYEMSLPMGNISDLAINAIQADTGTKNLLVLEGHNR